MIKLDDSTWIAILTWGGGVITWGLAAFFEWLSQDLFYRQEYRAVEAVMAHDPTYANVIGNIDAYLTTRGIHRPSIFHTLFRNAPQPLLVLSIIALTVLRPTNFSDWVHHTIAVLGVAAVIALTCLHEFKGKTDWAKNVFYQAIVYLVWPAYFFLVLWLVPSHAAGG